MIAPFKQTRAGTKGKAEAVEGGEAQKQFTGARGGDEGAARGVGRFKA